MINIWKNDMGIPVKRFIDHLDLCFQKNDMKAAGECISYWENEARRLSDDRGLLTVINEALGYFRRINGKDKALSVVNECMDLVERLNLSDQLTGATILINAATTLSAFKETQKALPVYENAADIFKIRNATITYEYASLLNNMASALYELKRYDEAKAAWNEAIDILKKIGSHAGEIAVSLIMLAHLTYDMDDTAYDTVEELLDLAWEYINSDDQPKDHRYAFILSKCVPSFEYFKRPLEAKALKEVIDEIYSGL